MFLLILTLTVVTVLLILVNALYVAGEFAVVSARKTRIRQMAHDGQPLASVLLPVLEDPQRLDSYIAACQVGITLSSIVLGIYGQQQIAPLIEPWIEKLAPSLDPAAAGGVAAAGIAAALVLVAMTTLQVILGELLPKTVALRYPETVALATVLPVRWSAEYILKPLIVLLNGSGALILRLLGIKAHHEGALLHSPEEIVILLQESFRGGLIDADPLSFISNVFRVSDTPVGDVATPRNRLMGVAIDTAVQEVLQLASDSDYSRILVYEDDVDHIVGYVHLRDLFLACQPGRDAELGEIIRPAPFVPKTLTVTQTWNRLNETQAYLAIVFDEYGGTAGLITREDLIEEFFGEVQDEFDREQEPIRAMSPDRYEVRGDISISDLNVQLGLNLPEDRARTVGGLMVAFLGRIPRLRDTIMIEGVRFEVEAMVGKSIVRVILTRQNAHGPDAPRSDPPS